MPSPTSDANPNPYQAPVDDEKALERLADDAVPQETLRKFRQQIHQLGGFWIFIGAAVLGMSGFQLNLLLRVENSRAANVVAIYFSILAVAGLVWVSLGVLACTKHLWSVYTGLALTYLSTISQLLTMRPIPLLICIVVIIQSHRVLSWGRIIQRAGFPLTTRPTPNPVGNPTAKPTPTSNQWRPYD